MRAPLAVRLDSAGTDLHVDAELIDDLTYSSTMPGGYKDLSLSLRRPLTELPRELDPYTRVVVYDRRHGGTLWEGWLEQPARTNRNGPVWRLRAVGPQAAAADVTRPLVYVDSRMSEWERVGDFGLGGTPNAVVEHTGGAGEAPGLRTSFPRGLVVPANGQVCVRYPHLATSGQRPGRVTATHVEGRTTLSVAQQIVVRTAGLTGTVAVSQTHSTTQATLVARLGTEISTSGPQVYADYRQFFSGGGTIGDDLTWSNATILRTLASRYTQAGAELVTAADYPNDYVLPHEVVADLLGRPGLLPRYDATGASVSTASTVQITQLAHEGGATPAEILDDLMGLDPAMRWAAWETTPAGKYRFVWETWPTTPTLVATAVDGFDAPGDSADLYNTARVRWVDEQRRTRWSTYTQTVPLLDAAGISREGMVDLGSAGGSQTAADAAGVGWLAEHLWPSNNGTLIVARPVTDLGAGRAVDPWELVAGPLVKVRDIEGRRDALNTSDRDGQTVFRAVEVEYSARRGTATVTLDAYPESMVRALARLATTTGRTRRP